MNIPKSDFQETEKLFNEVHKSNLEVHQYREITYGNYDRMQLIPANSFSTFTRESGKAYDWYGTSQAILLFPLEKNTAKRSFKWGYSEQRKRNIVSVG